MEKNNKKFLKSSKKGSNNAFTLVEVIAVLVILSIIALITSPVIIGLIEDARIKSASVSAHGALEAVKVTILQARIDKNQLSNGQYVLNGDKISKDGVEYTVAYRGTRIQNSTLTIENNEIINGCFKVNGFSMYYDGNEIKNEECSLLDPEPEIPKETLKDVLITADTEAETELTKEININGHVVNKVYSGSRTSNNYVWFSGNLWQIMEINDDNIKLVTALPVTSIAYGENNNYDGSWVKKWLETVFYPGLTDKDLIKKTKFCLDTVRASMEYTNTKVVSHNKITSCSNEIQAYVGLMSFEDYVYAKTGDTPNYNSASYLSAQEAEWTLSPIMDKLVWITHSNDDYITKNTTFKTDAYGLGVRPVISLSSSATIDRGTGANNDPFVITSKEKVNPNSSIRNIKVGEYLFLDESGAANPSPSSYKEYVADSIGYTTTKSKVRYRVVKINTDGSVKVQRADILRNLTSDIAINEKEYVPFYYSNTCKSSGSSGCLGHNIFNPTTETEDYDYRDGKNIGNYLNYAGNSFYNWFSDSQKNKIKTTTYELYTTGYERDYSSLGTDGRVTANVALPSWGEMYAGNDLDMGYWLINRHHDDSYAAGIISALGYGDSTSIENGWFSVRPVVTLKSTNIISSGYGTMSEPYTLR